jgi:vitamin-K-epoxide reductase (warfarin-sensitive)
MQIYLLKPLVCICGLIVSLYAVYIHIKSDEDKDYAATCDISEIVSCTAVVKSDYGNIFSKFGIIKSGSMLDMPNSTYGRLLNINIHTSLK